MNLRIITALKGVINFLRQTDRQPISLGIASARFQRRFFRVDSRARPALSQFSVFCFYYNQVFLILLAIRAIYLLPEISLETDRAPEWERTKRRPELKTWETIELESKFRKLTNQRTWFLLFFYFFIFVLFLFLLVFLLLVPVWPRKTCARSFDAYFSAKFITTWLGPDIMIYVSWHCQ